MPTARADRPGSGPPPTRRGVAPAHSPRRGGHLGDLLDARRGGSPVMPPNARLARIATPPPRPWRRAPADRPTTPSPARRSPPRATRPPPPPGADGSGVVGAEAIGDGRRGQQPSSPRPRRSPNAWAATSPAKAAAGPRVVTARPTRSTMEPHERGHAVGCRGADPSGFVAALAGRTAGEGVGDVGEPVLVEGARHQHAEQARRRRRPRAPGRGGRARRRSPPTAGADQRADDRKPRDDGGGSVRVRPRIGTAVRNWTAPANPVRSFNAHRAVDRLLRSRSRCGHRAGLSRTTRRTSGPR